MQPDKIVRMANQIGMFFAAQPGGAIEGIADHIAKFWEPRMRRALFDHLEAGGAGLDPPVREAAERLRSQTSVRG